MKNALKENEDFLYLRVASRIENLIDNEVLKVGDKLPSVRSLSKEQGISVSTSFQAYYHLENKGLIEPRPKSGYYVKFTPKQFPKTPAVSNPSPFPKEVSMAEMARNVMRDASREDITKFSVTIPAFELLPAPKLNKSLVHVMRKSPNNGLNYETLQGNYNLRKQIAIKSLDWGGSLNSDDVIITTGCMEALIFSLRAVTQPGDTVAVESPTYYGILLALESIGLKVVELSTDPSTGINLNELEESILKYDIKACLFILNFNNPIGSCMPDEKKKRLVELLARYEIPLIEDDIYGEIYFGKSRPKNCKAFDKKGLVLLCSSVSKTLAPGYRVGWVIPGRYKDKILNLKMTSTISSASLTQAAVGHFLENGRFESHLKKLRAAFHTQMLRYTQIIAAHFPECTLVTRPSGGYAIWLELNPKIDCLDLLNEALEKKISFAPGVIFTSQNRYKNCLRISCGQPWSENIKAALIRIGELAKNMIRNEKN